MILSEKNIFNGKFEFILGSPVDIRPSPAPPKKYVENFKPAIGLSPLEVGEYLRSPEVQ